MSPVASTTSWSRISSPILSRRSPLCSRRASDPAGGSHCPASSNRRRRTWRRATRARFVSRRPPCSTAGCCLPACGSEPRHPLPDLRGAVPGVPGSAPGARRTGSLRALQSGVQRSRAPRSRIGQTRFIGRERRARWRCAPRSKLLAKQRPRGAPRGVVGSPPSPRPASGAFERAVCPPRPLHPPRTGCAGSGERSHCPRCSSCRWQRSSRSGSATCWPPSTPPCAAFWSRLCGIAGCEVRLPQAVDRLSIEGGRR